MRQVISTAVIAVIVGALAGATMSAVAQAPAEQAITPAAGINAATVDGKSAVGYTNKKNVRRGKLVATNKVGELPSNIVRPFWGYIKNAPAGFADGVDNEGVTGVKLTYVETATNTLAAGAQMADTAFCPAGTKVTGGGFWSSAYGFDLIRSQPYDNLVGWAVGGRNITGSSMDVITMAVCMSTTPSGALTTATRG